jgi:protein-L-isoaspartate(D-aspartate) O-methyltransferase
VPWAPPHPTERQDERDALTKYIHDNYGLEDNETLAALREVPRHEFVPLELSGHAYDDTPLPIAYSQLISQPWIVALMTHELQLKPTSKVLEIGTGSGYQAAVLTHFTKKVFSIEIIKPMAEAAAERLKRLNYTPIQLRIADGFNGWPEEAPFDAIIVTCAAGQIPPPLIKQLAPGGRMMIPVGQPFATQSLMRVVKDENGAVSTESLAPVRFVPLTDKDISAPTK